MINEFGPYKSSLDPNYAKTDQTRKLIVPEGYCNNGIPPAAGPLPASSTDRANVAVSASAWNCNPYFGNFYNYYTNQPYELGEGSQQYASYQKYEPQYPRNYGHQPIPSTSVLQCCDPRCQFLCENSKYQFNQSYCSKALSALPPKPAKNYQNSIALDTPKPEVQKFEHFPVKYQSCISYSTNANDLNNKYNNQQSVCSSHYQNSVKPSKSVAIPDAAPSPSEFYTDIGKPAYWNKALWNRNAQHNYYPPVDIGKNMHQKLSNPVYEQNGCIPGNQAGGGILFNRLLESGNRSYENNTFVPSYPASNTNQSKSDCKLGYVNLNYTLPDNVYNSTRLPLPNSVYQQPQPVHNIHYTAESNQNASLEGSMLQITENKTPLNNQRITDKNPNLDVRQFLSTWDDEEDDKSTDNGSVEPQVGLDCKTVENNASVGIDEKEAAECNSLVPNFIPHNNQDKSNGIAEAKSGERANNENISSLHTSVIQGDNNNTTTKSIAKLVTCNQSIDAVLESSQCNPDRYSLLYDNLKKNNDKMVEKCDNPVTVGRCESSKCGLALMTEDNPQTRKHNFEKEYMNSEWNINPQSNPKYNNRGLVDNSDPIAEQITENKSKEYAENSTIMISNISQDIGISKGQQKNNPFSVSDKVNTDFTNIFNYPKESSTTVACTIPQIQDYSFKPKNIYEPNDLYNTTLSATHSYPTSSSMGCSDSYYSNLNDCNYRTDSTSSQSICNKKQGNYVENIDKNIENNPDISLDLEKSLNEITHQLAICTNNQTQLVGNNLTVSKAKETIDFVTHNSQIALDCSDNICKVVETDSAELDISTCIKHIKNIEPAAYNGVIHKTGTCDDCKFCDEDQSLSMPSLSHPTASESEDNTEVNVQKPIDSSNITLNDVYDDNAIIFDTEGSNIGKPDCNDNFNLELSVDVNIEIHQPLNLALSRISPRSNGTHTSVVKVCKIPESDTQELIVPELDHKNPADIITSKVDNGYYSVESHLDGESDMQKKPLSPSKEQLLHYPNYQNVNVDVNTKFQSAPYQTCIVSCRKYECHIDKYDQKSNIEGKPLLAPVDNRTIYEPIVKQEESNTVSKDNNSSVIPASIYNGNLQDQNIYSDTNPNTDYSYLCKNYKSAHEISYKHNKKNIDLHDDTYQNTTNLYNCTQEKHVGTEVLEKNDSSNNEVSQNENDNALISTGSNITNISELLSKEYIPSDNSLTCTTFTNNDDHNAGMSQDYFRCNNFNESVEVTNSATHRSTVNISGEFEEHVHSTIQESDPCAIILHKDGSLDKMENSSNEKQYLHYGKNCESSESMNCDTQNKSESCNVETCERDFNYGIDLSTHSNINEENIKDRNSNSNADFQHRILNYDKEIKNDVNENPFTTDCSLNLYMLATSSNETNLSKISKFSQKIETNSMNIKNQQGNSINEDTFQTAHMVKSDTVMNNFQNQKTNGSGINDETIYRSTYLNPGDGTITIKPSCNDTLLELHKESTIHYNNGSTLPVSQGKKLEHMNLKEIKYKKNYGNLYKTSVNNNFDTISYINNSDYCSKNVNSTYKTQATMNNATMERELGNKCLNYKTGKRYSTTYEDDNSINIKRMKTNFDSTLISYSTEFTNNNYKVRCNQKSNSAAEIHNFSEKTDISHTEMYGKYSCMPSKKQKKKQSKERLKSEINIKKSKNLIHILRNSDCQVHKTEIYKLNKKRYKLNNNELWCPNSHLSNTQLPKSESDVLKNNYHKESKLFDLKETQDSYIDSPSISDLTHCDWYNNSSNKISSAHQIRNNSFSSNAKSFQQIHHIEFDEGNKSEDDGGKDNIFLDDLYITQNVAPTPHCDLSREEIMDYELLPECPQFLATKEGLQDPSFNVPTPHCDFPNEDNMPNKNLNVDLENCKAPSPNFVLYDDGDDVRVFSTTPLPWYTLNDFISNNVELVKEDFDDSLNNIPSSQITSIALSPQFDVNTGGDENDSSVCSHLQNRVPTLKNLAFNALGHIGVYIDTLLSNDLNIFEIRLSSEQTEIIVNTEDEFSTDTLICDREFDLKCNEEEEDQPYQCLIISNKESVVCLRCPLNSSLIINDTRTTEDCTDDDKDTHKEISGTDDKSVCECIEESFIDQKISLSPSHVLEDYEFLSVYTQLSRTNYFNLRKEYVEEQIKVELPWQKIFDLEKHPKQCSVLKQLELGPAQIEVRIPCPEMQTKNVMNCKQEHSSPVLKVKRLIIQPAINVDDTQNSYSFVLTAGDERVANKGEECEKYENVETRTMKVSMTAVEEIQKCGSNEILAVPKMVIKKTKYREYKSYFQSNCCKVLQPQVRLNRSRSLDELALKFTQEKERYSFDLNDFKKHLTPDWGIKFDYNENQYSSPECEADVSSLEEGPAVDEIERGIQEICKTLKDTSVGESIEIRKPERHHCLLCHRSYSSAEKYVLHVKSKFHRHLELTQRKTIHAIYRHFTGSICPRLRPLTAYERKKMKWKPRDPNVRHFYHEKTPLQIALHKWTSIRN